MNPTISKRLPFICLVLLSANLHGEYLGAGGGYTLFQHTYLSDLSNLATTHYELQADFSQYRRDTLGMFIRGPLTSVKTGLNYQDLYAQIPIYHWHHQHGIWVSYRNTTFDGLEATLGADHTYLAGDGTRLDLVKGTPVTSSIEHRTYEVVWRSEAKYRGVANQAGIYQRQLSTPMMATIEGQTAELFDGTATGWGVMVGRHQDLKGWNYQWLFKLGQNQIKLSDAALPDSAKSRSESRQNYLQLDLSWHYRYFVSPYWYLVPYLVQNVKLSYQSKSMPSTIKHDSYISSETQVGVTIRRYF